MCWKNVKRFLTQPNSISTQLTFFYSISAIIILIIVSIFFYLGMVEVLDKASRQYLLEEVEVIRGILVTHPQDLTALKQEVTEAPLALTDFAYHCYIRILDPRNVVLIETPNMSTIVGQPAFFQTKHTSSAIHMIQWQSPSQLLYLLGNTKVKAHDNEWQIQIALDTTYPQNIIKTYRFIVVIILVLAALLSIIIGRMISRRAMRSLSEMTATTRQITITSLQQRINPEHWPNELRELGKAFNHMLDRIEVAFVRLIEFSDNLAHELRTPITNLMGETEIVLFQGTTTNAFRKVMESNLEELTRMHQIIENILFLARAENPRMAIRKELLNVNKETSVIIQFYQAMADEKNIQLICSGNTELYAEPTLFRRMINNVLSNAIKYAFDNTEIHFHIDEIDKRIVRITLQDQGIGISTEQQDKIFDRFYRADAARSQGGFGLGLSIVKSIIELHRGSVSVHSQLGQGTMIIIHLPKNDDFVI